MKRFVHIGLGSVVVAAMAAAPASAAQPTPASGATWSQNQRVEYRWREGSEPPGWAKAAMNAAAGDSNASRRAKAAIFAYDPAGPAWLGYTDDIPSNFAIGYAIRNTPDSFTIRIRPHGTRLDWGTLRWCEFYDDPPNGCYDMEMVTLHEFGHVQTLGHVSEAEIDSYTDSVMHTVGLRTKPKTGWNQHVYGRCDVARLQIRYQPLNAETPISTCLDLATELTLGPGSASVASGSSVTLTARLRIAGDEVYPLLAGEPLAGRSVVLQRRAPGASSWANFSELSPVLDGSGRYVKTLTLTATYDWRAIFSAPGDEGLRGSTSGVSRLTVTVIGCPDGVGASRPAPVGIEPLQETC